MVGVAALITSATAPGIAAAQAEDRIEIYPGITADPKTVPRRRMAEDDDD